MIDSDDWSVLHTINMIEGAGRDWSGGDFCPPRMGIGDISRGDTVGRSFGGQWDHHGHQNGLEVDIRYVRTDTLEGALNIVSDSMHYYRIATGMLINFLLRNCIGEAIIASPYCHLVFEDVDVVYDESGVHDNHFHLRIVDPDSTWNRTLN